MGFVQQLQLISAVKSGDTERVATLIADGADPEATSTQGFRALALAALYGHGSVIDVLVTNGADVNAESTVSHPVTDGVTALMAACHDSTGRTDIVLQLIRHGARLDETDSVGRTALMYAVLSGYYEIVRVLTDQGADTSICTTEGHSPMDVARESGDSRILQALARSSTTTK